ncbi:hypothetical protein PDESU_04709 [Pontiella desulfatans]|uniref:Uncharacterized protein n=1 Tax=Pontiella desulfatans TaxID=2750659 RepID=A0A6C2U8B4_PONDE|nr:hypothetical protein [Pontiella desulfatans]VGO16119.1 hypothetical protein PDESU_04709 [Pontiella desulfatans]
MKKLVMAVAVLACASAVVAQTVTSANIVGYTKVNAVGGELSLVALNFETGGTTLQDMIGTDVPALSFVYLWDKDTSAYTSASLNTRGSWTPNLTVDIGDAMWIQAAGAGTNELIFSGEVLTSNSVWALPAGIVATGYSFPVEKDFKTTQAATDLAALSFLYMWDEGTQSYAAWSKNTRGTWTGTGDPIMDPKEGFWIDNAGSAIVVDEPVPFTP